MTELIPIFPLQIVLFPTEDLNLHIFEPRYKQLIGQCHRNESSFGIPTVLSGRLAGIGTEAKINDIINVYPDGRIDLTVTGVRRFEIRNYLKPFPEMLYDGAQIIWLPDEMNVSESTQKRLVLLVREIYKALQLSKPGLTDRDNITSYEVAHFVGMSVEQEYEMLVLGSEEDRQKYLIGFLEKIMPSFHSIDRMKERIAMNGHFREFDELDFDF